MGDRINAAEAAKRLGLTLRDVYALIDGGTLAAWQGGRRNVLVDADEVDSLGSGGDDAGVREPLDPRPQGGVDAIALASPGRRDVDDQA